MADIHSFARSGDAEGVAAAIAADPKCVRTTDKLSRTPLHLAAWAGHDRIVRTLLEAKANVHAGACDHMLALHFAAQNGHETVCKELLKVGAKVNAADAKKANTPLHMAAAKNHAATCAYLLKKNANVKARNKAGQVPAQLTSSAEVRTVLASKASGGGSAEEAEVADAEDAPLEVAAPPAVAAGPLVTAPSSTELPTTADASASDPVAEAGAETPSPVLAPPRPALPPPQLGRMAPPQLGGMAAPQLGRMAPPQLGGMAPPQLGRMAPPQLGAPSKRPAAGPVGKPKKPRPAGPALSFADDDDDDQ